MHAKWKSGILGFFLLCTIIPSYAQSLVFNMPRGVTPISHDIYDLHMAIFGICVFIGIVVFGLLIYSMFKYRKSLNRPPATFTHNSLVEITWVVIPSIILIVMAVPATIVLIRMHDYAKADVNIKVTGYQWKWRYEYLDNGISFYSTLSTPQTQIQGQEKKGPNYLLEVDKPLVVPIHKKIRFIVTSNDVIHSWWVPMLGIKRDAIPGFIHEAWARIDKPGEYHGQCAELCGINHAYMPIVVIAKTEPDYKQWIAQQTGTPTPTPTATTSPTPTTPTPPSAAKPPAAPSTPLNLQTLMQEGKVVYDKTCSVCHKPTGEGQPPVFPTLVGAKLTVGPVAGHIDIVLNGKPGTAMQSFKTQLSDRELAAVITFERNSWGNNDKQKYGKEAGGLVQPSDIIKAK